MRQACALVFIILTILLLPSISFASEISLHKVNIELREDGTAHVTAEVHYKELTTRDVPYFVLGRAYKIVARDKTGTLECSTTRQPYGTYISCIPSNRSVENYTVEFSFELSDLVSFNHNFDRFVYNYGIKEPTDSFVLRLVLPEGYGLVKPTTNFPSPYFPETAVIGSDGRHVTIEWHVDKPELGSTLTFNVMYEYVGIQPTRSIYYVAPLIGLLAFMSMALFKLRGRKSPIDVLTADERRVIDAIKEKGGKAVKQKDIVKATNFSKAKVSRLLASLEERGLVVRERVGRTNKVKLSKRI